MNREEANYYLKSSGFSDEQIDTIAKAYAEPKTGYWIWCIGSHKCSNCEEYTCFSHKEMLRYCPNCGAKMIEPQERSDNE